MARPATIQDVAVAMDRLYPTAAADLGDPIGLAVGDPRAPVSRVLFAVDPVQAVVNDAIAAGVDLIIVHHPLLFRAVHDVAASGPKGRTVHDLIVNGIGLYVAHTNADVAVGGVSESLAAAIGLQDLHPMRTSPEPPLDKLVTFVPSAAADQLVDAMAAAGAGSLGNYDRCAFLSQGVGTFRPREGAHPAIGVIGSVETVAETRVEMVLSRERRSAVVAALRSAHPYEEPAFDIVEMASLPSRAGVGTGRRGTLAEPMTLRQFATVVTDALPPTASGARVSGDVDTIVRTVGVLGGSGDFLLDEARAAGLDVFVTSDLRHHPASELREYDGAPALVDVPHWAAEWTWLPPAAQALAAAMEAAGMAVACDVSRRCTDPWNYRAASPAVPADHGSPSGPPVTDKELP